jgi:hypothetical protein
MSNASHASIGRDQPREQQQWSQQTHGADAARVHRRHLAVAIQAPEREHDAEKQTEGGEHEQVVDGGQTEQREHGVARQLACSRFAQDAGEAITHENEHEHERHGERRTERFAQQIAVEDPRHRSLKRGNSCTLGTRRPTPLPAFAAHSSWPTVKRRAG